MRHLFTGLQVATSIRMDIVLILVAYLVVAYARVGKDLHSCDISITRLFTYGDKSILPIHKKGYALKISLIPMACNQKNVYRSALNLRRVVVRIPTETKVFIWLDVQQNFTRFHQGSPRDPRAIPVRLTAASEIAEASRHKRSMPMSVGSPEG